MYCVFPCGSLDDANPVNLSVWAGPVKKRDDHFVVPVEIRSRKE